MKMREKSPIKQGLRRPTLGSTYPGSSASSSSERAALILISSSSASATSSRFRVLDFECGSYNNVGGRKVEEEPDIMWGPSRTTGPPSIQLTRILLGCNFSPLSGWSSPFWICQCDGTSELPPQGPGQGLEMDPGPGEEENN